MRRLVIGVVLLVLVTAAPAHAFNAPGPKWPGGTIRVHDTLPRSWNWSIERAVRTWNRSGAKVRFVRVPRSRAQVLIGYGDIGSAAGLATIGRRSGAFVDVNRLMFRPLRASDRIFAAQVLTHELGHVLGLGHVRSNNCRLMSTPLLTYCPKPPQPWLYDCAWLAKDDVRGAIHLYGGRPRPATREYCLLEPEPEQLAAVSLTGNRVTWSPGRWLPRTRVVLEAFDAARCAGDVTLAPLATTDVAADRARARVPAPAECYAVRVQNRYGLSQDPVLISR